MKHNSFTGRLQSSEIMRLCGLMRPGLGKYAALLLISALFGSANWLLVSFATGEAASAIEQGDASRAYTAALLLAVSLLAGIAGLVFDFGKDCCVARFLADLRQRAFEKIDKIPDAYYVKNLSGDLISRVTNDMGTFETLFREQLPDAVFFVVFGICSISCALAVDWRFGLLFTAMSFGFKLLNDHFVKAVKRLSRESYEKNAVLVQELTGILSGRAVMKIFGLEQKLYERYRSRNRDYTDTSIRLEFRKALQNTTNALMTSVTTNLALILGAAFVLAGWINVATLVVISQLAGSVTMMFRWTGQILSEAASTAVAGGRIRELLETAEEPEGFSLPAAPDVPHEIEFRHVTFSYDEKEAPALEDLSFTAERGQKIAFVGESGGGKSTILKLLLGFYDAQAGNLWVRGKCLSSYTRRELRALTAYVAQDSVLFDATIEENIRCGKPNASREEVERAAKLACAHDFILEQEEGYATHVGERAGRLSGGQRQRIAIARALLKDAPILLLDEATSALDAQSQEVVGEALRALMRGRTTLVVAHRLSTIEDADRIYVVNGGRVTESGTHRELLEKRGDYRKLYRMQFARGGADAEA